MDCSFSKRAMATLFVIGAAVVAFGENTSTALMGRVLTPDGRPLAHAQVNYSLVAGREGVNFSIYPPKMQTSGIVDTDAAGKFTINALSENGVIAISVFSQKDSLKYPQFFKQVEVMDKPLEIHLPQKGEKVAGRVLSLPEKLPVEGVMVIVCPYLSTHVSGMKSRFRLLGTPINLITDEQGHFETDMFPAGARMSVQTAKTDSSSWVMAPTEPDTYELDEGGSTTLPDLYVYPGYTISGVVRSGDGKPIAEARVIEIDKTSRSDRQYRPTVTDAAGRYRIEHLVPQKLEQGYLLSRLSVEATGYTSTYKDVKIVSFDPAQQDVSEDFILAK